MKYALLAIVACICLSTKAHACIPASFDTTSKELVTVQIGDTFFEFPESAFNFMFQATPGPTDKVTVSLSLPDDDEYHVMLLKRKSAPLMFSGEVAELPVNEDVVISLGQTQSYNRKPLTEKLLPYLQKMAKAEPPATWEDDKRILDKFEIESGQEPCADTSFGEGISRMFGYLFVHFVGDINTRYNEADISKGLAHRNFIVRLAAIRVAERYFGDNKKISALILDKTKNDNVNDVRYAATRAIGEIAKVDKSLVPALYEIFETNDDYWQRRTAARDLARLDTKFFEKTISLISLSDPKMLDVILEPFWQKLNEEYFHIQPVRFEQLSADTQAVLKALIKILQSTDDPELQHKIVAYLEPREPHRSLVQDKEYIEYLHKMTLMPNAWTIAIAIEALERHGLKPRNVQETIRLLMIDKDVARAKAIISKLEERK